MEQLQDVPVDSLFVDYFIIQTLFLFWLLMYWKIPQLRSKFCLTEGQNILFLVLHCKVCIFCSQKVLVLYQNVDKLFGKSMIVFDQN